MSSPAKQSSRIFNSNVKSVLLYCSETWKNLKSSTNIRQQIREDNLEDILIANEDLEISIVT